MHLYSDDDTRVLTDLLLVELPVTILTIVSETTPDGIGRGEIHRIVEGSLPGTIDLAMLDERIESILRWFVRNGDVDTAGSHRYVRVPPYVVRQKAVNGTASMRLLGDKRLDILIFDQVSAHNCFLHTETIMTSPSNDGGGTAFPVGIRRSITFPIESAGFVESCLEDLRIEIVDIDLLDRNLPTIHSLFYPPQNAFNAIAPKWGYWDNYDAALQSEDRWSRIDQWGTAKRGLLRWMPSLDRRGQYNCRYFLHDGCAHLAELGRSFAYLWMYHFDYEQRKPRRIWASGRDIWLPPKIPDAHWQLLALLSEYFEWSGAFRRYHLTCPAETVGERLNGTLGVQLIEAKPTLI